MNAQYYSAKFEIGDATVLAQKDGHYLVITTSRVVDFFDGEYKREEKTESITLVSNHHADALYYMLGQILGKEK